MSSVYKQFGIYKITNKIDGGTYIGKTGTNFGDRWDCHRAQLNGGYHDNPYLQEACNTFGCDSFEFSIVESVEDKTLLNDLEVKYISEYRQLGKCYNIHNGGDVGLNLGTHLSEETKRKIGEKNRINMTGKKASEETKKKMSESQKKRYAEWSEEDRIAYGEKIAQYASGYKWDEEAKKRMSERQKTHPNGAKYTIEQVKEIRRLHEEDNKNYNEISDIMNIPRHTVYLIATYKRWANV